MINNLGFRSGTSDFGGKRSVIFRTFSASRICRGDPLIDKEAHVSAGPGSSVERRPSAKIVNSSEVCMFLTNSNRGLQMIFLVGIVIMRKCFCF